MTIKFIINSCDQCNTDALTTRIELPEGWIVVQVPEQGLLNLCSWDCVFRHAADRAGIELLDRDSD